ncbi:helix-turn-helix domain-containing protein [uncultured Paludibaculum sp.]|uniref:helix-turn-helix domain-containing protein n=1 Tax=uncultured Paludibaculum sp. TaxID=1765020 RepID=UPI002AABFB59|nr:helix-turn-helix domain-containing protein [uncultured Paludibaculum sp.]
MDARDRKETERLSAVVLGTLDEESVRGTLPRRAHRSRTQFYRLFRALIEETPEAMRRRLLLERAAWQLGSTRLSVTEIALEASYGSLEAFTRAFRKAFRVSPSLYRRMGAQLIHLPAPNGFHFCAPGSKSEGALAMDLFDRFAGTDTWHTKKLLEAAAGLTDEQLDKPTGQVVNVLPWEKEPESLRAILERLVFTKEVWAAALLGGAMPEEKQPAEQRTPAGLLARFEKADADFLRALAEVRNRGSWDDTFIDALCEPAETFTFGGMFAHVITFNTYRRLIALGVLRELGVKVEGFGCPTEYEMAVAPWRGVEMAR